MKTQLLLIIVFLMLATLLGQAQDFTYSQYFANKTSLNPAFCVSERGVRLYTHWREQSPGIANTFLNHKGNVSFTFTKMLTPDIILGFGAMGNLQKEGEGGYSTNNFGAMMGAGLPFKLGDNNAIITTALQINRHTTRLHWNQLVFSDQLHEVREDILYTSNAIAPDNLTHTYPSFNWGSLMVLPFNKKTRLIAGYKMRWLSKDLNANFDNSYVGIASLHTVHIAMEYENTWRSSKDNGIVFFPNAKLDWQNGLSHINVGTFILSPEYRVAGNKQKGAYNTFWLGLFYQRSLQKIPEAYNGGVINENFFVTPQHTAAITPILGYRWKTEYSTNQVSMSTDIAVSGLNFGATWGNWELSYVLTLPEGFKNDSRKGSKKGPIKKFFQEIANPGGCPKFHATGDAMKL